jgi:hypothetical protein
MGKMICPKCKKENMKYQGIKSTHGAIYTRNVPGTFCSVYFCMECGEKIALPISKKEEQKWL